MWRAGQWVCVHACMHKHVQVCVSNMSWERSFVPVQVTSGEAGHNKGIKVLNESQESTGGSQQKYRGGVKKQLLGHRTTHTQTYNHCNASTPFTGLGKTPSTVWLPTCQHFFCTSVTHTQTCTHLLYLKLASCCDSSSRFIHWDNYTRDWLSSSS